MSAEGFIILGNQLFPLNHIKKYKSCHFFMAEDYELCSYFKFHKHKLIFFLASMRSYKDSLVKEGLKCHYEKLDEQKRDNNYEKKLKVFIKLNNIKKLKVFDIPDSFFRKRILKFCSSNKLELIIFKVPADLVIICDSCLTEAVPPTWKVLIVNCVPGSPID